MLYLAAIGLIVLAAIVLLANSTQKKQRKQLQYLRDAWGREKKDSFNIERIEQFLHLNPEGSFHTLAAQTKNDIDFYPLFCCVDRTTSKVGQQYLFYKLSNPTDDTSELLQLHEQALFFAANPTQREETQLQLLKLSSDDAYFITTLMHGSLYARPWWYTWLVFDVALTIAMLLLAPLYPALLVWLMAPFALNLGLHFWNKNNTYGFIKSFPQLNVLINLCKILVTKKLPCNDAAAVASIAALKPFQRKRRLLSFGQSASGSETEQVFYYFIELVKAIFLVDIFTFFSLVKELENKQTAIQTLFTYVGTIDMAISVASLRAGYGHTCQPHFLPAKKELFAKNICHPLVENCIANTLNLNGRGVLITGSNMSGKTTFLRTIAVNVLLAQTLYTCFAEKFEIPVLKLFSSIRIDDSLLDGKSFYFEEVNIMAGLINEATSGCQNMFILDEVFKGTNTVERIAAAKAILSYLNKGNNMVFVSTHDIELAGLLDNEYNLYHFAETIENDELIFDHTLKNGALKTRNAIRILEISGYPAEIIEEAKRLAF